MRRGNTGQYEITSAGGEQIRAFIPHPLPPDPPMDFSNARQRLLERATLALGGGLTATAVTAARPKHFPVHLYPPRGSAFFTNRRDPVLARRFAQLFELEEAPGVPFDDVVET